MTRAREPFDRKKLLIIAYLFPPAGGVGVQRALSFAKYLPQCGFEVHVLSALNPVVPTSDPELLKQLPPSVKLHRAFTPELPYGVRQMFWKLMGGGANKNQTEAEPAIAAPQRARNGLKGSLRNRLRQFFSPDPEVVWVPFARRRAEQIIARHGIGTVLVTAPPFSSLLIGAALKRRFPGMKLISDFRDEWFNFTLAVFDYHNDDSILRRARQIERDCVETSDLVVSVVPRIVQQMRDRYPEQPESRFACIPNGYDPELFADFRPRPHGGNRIVVTFVGTVYGPSTPAHYLDALDSLPEEIRRRFETRFVGRITADQQAIVNGRKSEVRLLGPLPYREALRKMEETDFLMITMLDPLCVTGKLLEYLATGKPILAIGPEGGEVCRMIEKFKGGWAADPGKPEAIREMLIRAQEMADSGSGFHPDREAFKAYERSQLSADLGRRIAALS